MAANTLEERFLDKISPEPNSGCWLWTACCTRAGYGAFNVNGKIKLAHRLSYERHKESIPDHLEIDHLCRVRSCVNPDHLEAVTPQENARRSHKYSIPARQAHARAQTHCKRDHPLSGDNLYIDKAGARVCRTCARNRMRKRRAAKKAQLNGE